ncbi:hypothetical protein G6F22_012675 [Rhizopus arrhizus]|nr:hypothetical protein G6F22_012675 [Rhizopus arrhizus]
MLEHRGDQRLQEDQHRLALLAHHRQRDAEQHGHEQHLQDVAVDEGAEQRLRDDVHQEADQGQVMRLLDVAVHRGLVQLGRVDVHAGAGLHHVRHDHADDQRQRGEEQEVRHRLGEHPAHGAQVGHAGDAGDDGQEDHRRDDHLHQVDEGVAERLHLLTDQRFVVAEDGAQDDRHDHLEVQLARDRQRLCRRRGCGRDVHGVLRKGRFQARTAPGQHGNRYRGN